MLHLKPFNEFSINESAETQEILYALQNTPEGRDLAALTKWPDWQGEMYEPKRTGRVYSTAFGSKMYMNKNDDGRYCWQSLSNGKIFAQGCFPTISQCIRDYWATVACNFLGIGGKSKQEEKELLKETIPVGRALLPDDIKREYMALKGVPNIDLNEIINSDAFKLIEKVYGAQATRKGKNLVISFNPYTPFYNICIGGVTYLNKSIQISTNLKGKNSIISQDEYLAENYPIKINIGDPAKLEEYFINALLKIRIELPSYLSRIETTPCEIIAQAYYSLIATNLKESPQDLKEPQGSTEAIVDNYIERIKDQNVMKYASIIRSFKTTGVFPELVKRHEEENRDTLTGASVIRRYR